MPAAVQNVGFLGKIKGGAVAVKGLIKKPFTNMTLKKGGLWALFLLAIVGVVGGIKFVIDRQNQNNQQN